MTTEHMTDVPIEVTPTQPQSINPPVSKLDMVVPILKSIFWAFAEFTLPIENIVSGIEDSRRIIIETSVKQIEKDRETIELIEKTARARQKDIDHYTALIHEELKKIPRKDQKGLIGQRHMKIAVAYRKTKKLYEDDLLKIQDKLFVLTKDELLRKGTILNVEISKSNKEFVTQMESHLKYTKISDVEDVKDKMQKVSDDAQALDDAVNADVSGVIFDDGMLEDELNGILNDMEGSDEVEVVKKEAKVTNQVDSIRIPGKSLRIDKDADDEMKSFANERVLVKN